MKTILGFLSIAGLAVLPQALAGNLIAFNGCPFQIYCASAKNDRSFTETVPVAPGETYWSPKPAYNDNIGSVVKCALSPTLRPVYQLELAVQDGRSWLDLSHVDGSPFLGYHRHAEIAGTSCVLDCPAGTEACEYPVQVDCQSEGDVVMTLCV
ncbi:hypothetical protein ONZ43_g2621 [Nemania bipapillata]|uniref:Uncharacterized protein n=1 Tax=Nemania bipapillata TaxID=110536 RepID=A0ACC2IZX5_9PEZI|nr:hypothetical protein ONZ43_g2621 [Nemania bipapillata]